MWRCTLWSIVVGFAAAAPLSIHADEVVSAEPLFGGDVGVVTLDGGGCRFPELCTEPKRLPICNEPQRRRCCQGPKWGWLPGPGAEPYDRYAVPCGVRWSYLAPAATNRYRYPYP
jgi:hypothetical protein